MDPALPLPPVTPLCWVGDAHGGGLEILDQTRLPAAEVRNLRTRSSEVVDDIRRLAVRGAPAIGLAGAYALVLLARELGRASTSEEGFGRALEAGARSVATARPTAVNLAAAVEHGLHAFRAGDRAPLAAPAVLLAAARALEAYERDASLAIARHGAAWLAGRRRFLTHCNAGALVTVGLGTALAPIYVLHKADPGVFVWVDETRPLLQGLRLTSYELGRAGVSHRVLVDGAAPSVIAAGDVDAVIVGADRVCANGDVVNKIGTLGVALAAHHHDVPFVVAAPLSTLDPATPEGRRVPIEDRGTDLPAYLVPGTAPVTPRVHGPAFDVTPARLVAALVTEAGVTERPDGRSLAPLLARARRLQAESPGVR